jgi:hypothetical protein
MKRVLALLLLAALPAFGDVLVLKDGTRVAGKVVEKATHYELTSEGVLKTYLKEEVEKVLASPKELLGDSDKLYEEAKADYPKLIAIADPAAQNAGLKEAVAKVTRAREAYAGALDLFPDDDSIGRKLMLIMQLMRLLRERMGSEIARKPAPGVAAAPPPAPPPPRVPPADEAFLTLVDPARRADPSKLGHALQVWRNRRRASDFAGAAAVFLAANPVLDAAALKAVQEYLEKPWVKEAEALPPEKHLEAARFLAERLPPLKGGPAAAALAPFALAHLASAPPGPEIEKHAKALGYQVQDGRVGTAEGLAVRDMTGWISGGDFDLAVLAFIREYRPIDTPAVRYVWSYALLRQVQSRKRGFDRPASAYETVKGPGPVQEHVAALVKSIRSAGVCNVCAGEGKLRCTNCHGKKEIRFVCGRCKGRGNNPNKFGVEIQCVPCKATGIEKLLKCEKCKEGFADCRQCETPKAAPSLDDIAGAEACRDCDGRGQAWLRAAVPCRGCLGLGLRLAPRLDPSKVLPPADAVR